MSTNSDRRMYYNITNTTDSDFFILQKDDVFKDFLNGLNIYLIPIIIIVGVFGNVISFLVFVATHLRRQSSSVYLAGLAVADISFLLSLFIGWFSWLRIHLFHRNVWCQIVVYITFVGSFLSVWCVVCFTTERYIIVSYPFKRHTLCTVKNARTVVISMSVFALCIYSFSIWTSGIVNYNGLPYCTVLPHYAKAVFVITTVDTFITLFLPSLIIIVLNIRITVLVYRFRKNRDILGNVTLSGRNYSHRADKAGCGCSNKSKGRVCACALTPTACTSVTRHTTTYRPLVQVKITRMLLVVSTTFILLNLPSHAVRIQSFVYSFTDSHDTKRSAVAMRFQELSQFMYYASFSINFFLYSLCGRNFRRSLNRLVNKLRYNVRKSCAYVLQAVTQPCSEHRNAQLEHITFSDIPNLGNI